MMDVKKWELDQRGNAYVEESLKFGLSLAQLFVSSNDLSQGQSYTYLPTSTPQDGIYKFSQGGKIFSPTNEVKDTLSIFVSELKDTLRANPSLLAVFENSLATKGDPWLEKRESKVFFVEDSGEVFHFSTSSEDLEIASRESVTLYGSAVYLIDLKDPKVADGQEVNKGFLNQLAKNVLKVFILNAYDGESFVVWERLQ